ncbi:DNA repair protein RAD50-like [Cylas formicarius]|uniref:DNA repair protein RAD50-like n=1 Tax=Cylas formicarius TaxID=197179 RepID=UPI002958A3B6|nr:DNA repair protein RAD50-like [Cylas formicarius]XP_060528975.1 DNA repair protein RAD50-like [Cylas formicarius]XP_060528976.1 DNA repair protein RAD50-like [Cylas formicarius]XP_060528977.1 DNA repair protein RAD50-like [Cylas formicarius]XP_060528978.1 DNA repair protein RAD50-like [Cylas formicarius]
MAVLEKLYIKGIRSFGPNDEEKVRFSTPLTLFLGQNGCGKTTIIESLKYALTGDLPGGVGSGNGFVNDPKLSNKSSTKGYVKVRFRDYRGDYVTVGKFVEVQAKSDGKLTFKSSNPSLRWEDGKHIKEPQDIAGRHINIDAYCAQKLNVSKAILNNVIFCHQENAAWPLDEGKKLKEKFDEIFGSTEYNKCVDRLRKQIGGQRNHIKVIKEQLEVKKQFKQNVDRIRSSLEAHEAQVETIKINIDKKKAEIEPMMQRIQEILDLEQVLGSLQEELSGKQNYLEGIDQHQQILRSHLDVEFDGTDQQLEEELENFNKRRGNIERDIKEKEDKRVQFEGKIVDFNKELQSLQLYLGKLSEEANQIKSKSTERDELIERLKVKVNLVCEDEESFDSVLEKLKVNIKKLEEGFLNIGKEIEAEEQKLQYAVDEVRDKYTSCKENIFSKENIIKEMSESKRSLREKLSQLSTSNSQLKFIEDQVRNVEEKLKKKKKDFDEYQQIQEIDELKEEIQRKENALTRLEKEHKVLQQNYVIQRTIDRQQAEIIDWKGEIEVINKKHEDNFVKLFGNAIPEVNCAIMLQDIQNREETKLTKLRKTISEHEKKIASIEAAVKHSKENLKNNEEELKINQKKIQRVCQGKDFAETLQECYNRKEKLQKDKGTYRSAKVMYEAFINEFEKEEPCCPICETDFSNKKGFTANIIKKLRHKIEEIPRKLASIEADLNKEEELYGQLQQLKTVHDNVQMIQDGKIPLFEQELQEARERLDETAMELALLKSQLQEPQEILEICKKVISDVTLLDRLNLDLAKSEESVESLKLELLKVPSNRSLEDTESEVASIKAELSNLRKKHENMKSLFDQTKESIQSLNANLQNEIQKKLEVQKLMQEKPLIEKQLSETSNKLTKTKEEIESLKMEVSSLKTELETAQKNRAHIVQKNKKLLEQKRLDLESIKRVFDDVQKSHNIIKRYEASGACERLETTNSKIQNQLEKIAKLEEAKRVLNEVISNKKQDMAGEESRLRALQDNKELRDSRKKSAKIESEIQELKKQIGNHNYSTVFKEKKRLESNMDAKRREVDIMLGEQGQIQASIKGFNAELSKPENKHAAAEYLKKYYELRVEELAISDLEVYTIALEKSILLFHKERMIQINKTIRELWRAIYKGNDIDYIEIQNEDTIGNTRKRRNYNYKVVEVKKGVQLEMRGRCSAGQKVLACLVIRMALAETFSANCGILALDEPTTNLDQDNISSLSDAISKIVTAREKQKNFQLLVITHDEEFLQTLTRDQSTSHYYRVSRNPDGFSQIRKEIL